MKNIFNLDGVLKLKFLGFCIALAGPAISNSFCGLGIAVYLAGLLAQFLFFRKISTFEPYPHRRWFYLLMSSLLISLFISSYFWISLRGFWKYVEGLILLYAGLDVLKTERRLWQALWVFGISALIAGVDGIVQDLTGLDFIYQKPAITIHLFRIIGTFKHYNDYGTYLAAAFLVAIAVFTMSLKNKKTKMALFWMILTWVLTYALMRTMSRSALISLLAGVFVFCLFFRFRFWILLGVLVVFLAAIFGSHDLTKRFAEFLTFKKGTSLDERFLLLRITLGMFFAHPIFGLGLNTYTNYFKAYSPDTYPGFMYAHNSFAQLAAETGLFGIGTFLGFIGANLVGFFRSWRIDRVGRYRFILAGLLAALIAFLVNGCFESVFQSTRLRALFWGLMGITAGLHCLINRSVRPSE